MVTKICKARKNETADAVVARFRDSKNAYDTVDYTYVTDDNGVLEGVVSIKELLNARSRDTIGKLMTSKVSVVHPSTDQERVAMIALKQNIKSVPVVDKEQRILGVVPSDVILNILHWEHTEDMLRLSGVQGKGENFRNLVKKGVIAMSKARIPSLLIGLMGGILATGVVKGFEKSLEEELLLAFFIPIMLYACAAVGTQTGTILVRTLATESVNIGKYILREIVVGFIIATLLSSIMLGVVLFWFRDYAVALTVALSLFAGVLTAVMLGILIPWTLAKFKQDPAISGGPFINMAQDVLTLLIYFAVAEAILI